MSLVVRLLGKCQIERDGLRVAPPRGRKSWALLAYLALSELPATRSRLASLLFADAHDPLAALRWSLAQLRRTLGDPDALRGDPLVLELAGEATVDVIELTRSDDRLGKGLSAVFEGELLEGLSFPSSPVFESWLELERRQLAAANQARLREAALGMLANGDASAATELASRLVKLDPLEQSSQELLIRCLARSGDQRAAEQQLMACERLFQRELGIEPPPELRTAADETDDPTAGAVGDSGAALGQLEAGRAALDAGAVEPGMECLRLACAEASACGDASLRARCLAALGSALVHSVRGRDEEGAASLHEALALAESAGDRATAVTICREIGYIDVQAGRGQAGGRWLSRATKLAQGDEERCAVLAVRGMALSDRAYYGAALELLGESVAVAKRCGRLRQAAWSVSLVGRLHLLRGDLIPAAAAVDESLELVARENWTAFQPWPEALRAELSLLAGSVDQARERADHSFRLACRLGDPCWEGMGARAIGLISASEGDAPKAREWLDEARSRVARASDPYQWVHAHALDSAAGLAIEADADDAGEIVDLLEAVAEPAAMRELVVRARVHRARLGDPNALEAARLLAAEIDNPALERLVEGTVMA